MTFIHQPYYPGKTIAAIATPPGEGGVAIIRLSGKEAFSIAARLFSGPVAEYKSHTAHFGHLCNLQGEHIDDVLLFVMRGKRSFTGEDTVEIHCHGGRLITRRVLEAVLSAGAHAAAPGEFTFKAFMNGKIDLIQAEAIQSLIGAKNEMALDAAEGQLTGSLSQKVAQFQAILTQIAAILEAWVDFPEEGLEFASMEEVAEQLNDCASEMEKLLNTFHNGKVLHDGLSLCLTGCPNVGKSSLMNALLDKERAIVSPIPGTTRDVLEDHLTLNGLHLKVSDTAGIRESSELIEQEGIRRSRLAIDQSDLILLVLDASKGIQQEDRELIALLPQHKTIAIWNKIDLPHAAPEELPFSHIVPLSAMQKEGLEELRKAIDEVVWQNGPPSKDEVVLTNARHKEALSKALNAVCQVRDGLQNGISPEFLHLEMRTSLLELGRMIGTDITEDILSAIFSTFCIGK